jgi:hypothetical protein
MKYIIRLLISFHLLGLVISLQAQTAVPTTGGNASGSGGSVSYSIGQIVYTVASGSNGKIIQGAQQPYEISVITGIEDEGIRLSISVYPNPATDYLKLKIENLNLEKLSYWLFDFKGTLMGNKKIEQIETEVNMQRMPSGIYVLKITQGYKEVKTFKIIKNQ